MNKENKMLNMLKKQETVLNNSPPIMKELALTLKKLPKSHSPFLTYNQDSKVSSLLLTPENLKFNSSVTEINQLEMNNNSTKKISL